MSDFDKATLQSKWEKLIEDEEAQFLLLCTMDNEPPVNTKEKAKALQKWWQIANAILWMMTRAKAQSNIDLTPFPSFTLGRLANIAEEISNGIIPTFITDAASGGRPLHRSERHHIAYGVAYIEAVKRGEIDDPSYNKTVRQAYNVTKVAVQQWCKKRDTICVGVPFKHLNSDQLKKKMIEAAKIYSRIGRGAPSDN